MVQSLQTNFFSFAINRSDLSSPWWSKSLQEMGGEGAGVFATSVHRHTRLGLRRVLLGSWDKIAASFCEISLRPRALAKRLPAISASTTNLQSISRSQHATATQGEHCKPVTGLFATKSCQYPNMRHYRSSDSEILYSDSVRKFNYRLTIPIMAPDTTGKQERAFKNQQNLSEVKFGFYNARNHQRNTNTS